MSISARTRLGLAGALIVLAVGAPPALAAPTTGTSSVAPLRVGISPFAPYVVKGRAPGDAPSGYSIELWREIAAAMGRRTEFVSAPGVQAKLDALASGATDVAIGGITMTAERERRFDFTHPVHAAGLGILLPGDGSPPTLWQTLRGGLGRTKTGVVFAFLILVLVSGHLIWLAERGKDAFDDKYIPGVLEGIYWAVVTASTVGYGDKAPVKWAGRFLACLVIVISLPMFALFTAELASAFTVERIESRVRGPDDLRGQRVGVVRGTTSAVFAAGLGLDVWPWETADEVYAALERGEVEAIVYDQPSLFHYAQGEGRGKVHLAGSPFERRNLAIAVPNGSPLREEINRALLELTERGRLRALQLEWLGRR